MGGGEREREGDQIRRRRERERERERKMTEMNSYYPAGGEGNEGRSE